MKRILVTMLCVVLCTCCSKTSVPGEISSGTSNGGDSHDMIVLGDKLEDPYTVENMTKALASLYPTKANVVPVTPTDMYVRFLPKTDEEYERLQSLGIELLDHPMDYAIVREGDYYQDPEIEEGEMTWQYSVVPIDFVAPSGIRCEVLDKCYLAEHDVQSKAAGVDWEAVERESYRLTGNAGMLSDQTKGGGSCPQGRITIMDEDYSDKPIAVSGVRVMCNSFIKFSSAYTDAEGNYKLTKTYSSNVRYRLVFKNIKGFGIGFNLILIPASVSSLGSNPPSGLDVTVTSSSDRRLFSRCVVNNAGYDYYTACKDKGMTMKTPPGNMRLWLFQNLNASLPVMLQQGAIIDNGQIGKFLGVYASLIKVLLPDACVGLKGRNSYAEIYAEALHQFAHGSHFMSVGTDFWDRLIKYDVKSYLLSGRIYYGAGTETDHEYCEIAEMWAYYLQTVMYRNRYQNTDISFGTQYWFTPQLLLYMDERGLTRSRLFAAFTSDVTNKDLLKEKLLNLYPESKSIINQAFVRYE